MKLKLSKNKIQKLLKGKNQTKRKFKNKQLQRVSSFRKKRAYNLRNKTLKPLHKKIVKRKPKVFARERNVNANVRKHYQKGGDNPRLDELMTNVKDSDTYEDLFDNISRIAEANVTTMEIQQVRRQLIVDRQTLDNKRSAEQAAAAAPEAQAAPEALKVQARYKITDMIDLFSRQFSRGVMQGRVAKYSSQIMGINELINQELRRISEDNSVWQGSMFGTSGRKRSQAAATLEEGEFTPAGFVWLNTLFEEVNENCVAEFHYDFGQLYNPDSSQIAQGNRDKLKLNNRPDVMNIENHNLRTQIQVGYNGNINKITNIGGDFSKSRAVFNIFDIMVNSNTLPDSTKLLKAVEFAQSVIDGQYTVSELDLTRSNYYNNYYNVITNGVGLVTWARNKLSQNTGSTKSRKKKEHYTDILSIALWALQQYEKIVLNYKLDNKIVDCILLNNNSDQNIAKIDKLKNLISSLVIILDNKLMNSKKVSSLIVSNQTNNSVPEYSAPNVPLELLNIFTFRPELDPAAQAAAAQAAAAQAAAAQAAAAPAGAAGPAALAAAAPPPEKYILLYRSENSVKAQLKVNEMDKDTSEQSFNQLTRRIPNDALKYETIKQLTLYYLTHIDQNMSIDRDGPAADAALAGLNPQEYAQLGGTRLDYANKIRFTQKVMENYNKTDALEKVEGFPYPIIYPELLQMFSLEGYFARTMENPNKDEVNNDASDFSTESKRSASKKLFQINYKICPGSGCTVKTNNFSGDNIDGTENLEKSTFTIGGIISSVPSDLKISRYYDDDTVDTNSYETGKLEFFSKFNEKLKKFSEKSLECNTNQDYYCNLLYQVLYLYRVYNILQHSNSRTPDKTDLFKNNLEQDELKTALKQINTNWSTVERIESAEDVASSSQKVDTLNQQKESLLQENQNISQQRTQIDGQIASKTQRQETIKQDIGRLQEELNDATDEREVVRINDDIQDLRRENLTIGGEITGLQDRQTTLQRQETRNTRSVASIDDEVQVMRDETLRTAGLPVYSSSDGAGAGETGASATGASATGASGISPEVNEELQRIMEKLDSLETMIKEQNPQAGDIQSLNKQVDDVRNNLLQAVKEAQTLKDKSSGSRKWIVQGNLNNGYARLVQEENPLSQESNPSSSLAAALNLLNKLPSIGQDVTPEESSGSSSGEEDSFSSLSALAQSLQGLTDQVATLNPVVGPAGTEAGPEAGPPPEAAQQQGPWARRQRAQQRADDGPERGLSTEDPGFASLYGDDED